MYSVARDTLMTSILFNAHHHEFKIVVGKGLIFGRGPKHLLFSGDYHGIIMACCDIQDIHVSTYRYMHVHVHVGVLSL